MFSKFRLYLFVQILLGKYCSSQIDCNSYTSCVNSGTRVPDPLDCRNYRYCTYGPFGHFIPTDHSYACSSKYYFDPVRGSCSYGTCTHDCVNICSLECATFENETVAVPNDCSSFYTCTPNHIKIKSQCPPEAPYFSGTICSPNSYSCCDSCVPYCKESYIQVPDPFDCRNYYLCSAIGVPSKEDKNRCPEGQYFNPYVGKCALEDSYNSCSPYCFPKPRTTGATNPFITYTTEFLTTYFKAI
ncbi:UNVERIFIED_CONTAM: hypothetical protein RMT77_010388 [Armadillidium vulgare]